MRTVRTDDGTAWVLLRTSDEQVRVRRLDSGDVRTESPDAFAGATVIDVPESIATAVSPGQADRALALLTELRARGPTAVRTLLDESDLCESDLHGLVAELRLAELLEETTVVGERGYRATTAAERAIDGIDGYG